MTLAFGTTLVLLCISMLGMMFRMYGLLTDLNAKVEATTAKVEVNTSKIEALDARVEAVAAEVAENREQIGQLRAETIAEFRQVRAESREDSGVLRTENRDSLSEMGRRIDRLRDRVDANAAKHDTNIIDVGKQVAAFNERVTRVEGYIEGMTGREWPVASGQ